MRVGALVLVCTFLLMGCANSTVATSNPSLSPSPVASPAPSPTLAPQTVSSPSFPPGRVATRVVITTLGIDLPIMLQKDGDFPLCDVALYLPQLGQPGQGRATFVYAHARDGMFLSLLAGSQDNSGQTMLGDIVEIYTSDSFRYRFKISEVNRHTLDLTQAFNTTTERLFLQTSEGPHGTVPKLQVVADFVSSDQTDPKAAHPDAHPKVCS